MNLLLTVATMAEIEPLRLFLQQNWDMLSHDTAFRRGNNTIRICISGVGMMAATYALASVLHETKIDFAVQAGIAGAYHNQLHMGDIVAVGSEQLGDLGAEDHDAYLDIFSLGLADRDAFPFTGGKLINNTRAPFALDDIPVVQSLTVNTGGGSAATIQRRQTLYNCDIESMEGAAFHYVCLQEQIPFLQVRCISNYVEPRDRNKWKIKEAVENLNKWLCKSIVNGQW